MTRFPSAVAVLTAALTLAACRSDSTAPEASPIAGTYTATQLSVTEGGFSVDALGLGVSLTMTLTSPSAVSGTLIVPAAVSESGRNEVNNLVGTFTQRADTVRFTQAADTFVRDIPFLVRGNTLVATNARAGAATYTVVLTRQ